MLPLLHFIIRGKTLIFLFTSTHFLESLYLLLIEHFCKVPGSQVLVHHEPHEYHSQSDFGGDPIRSHPCIEKAIIQINAPLGQWAISILSAYDMFANHNSLYWRYGWAEAQVHLSVWPYLFAYMLASFCLASFRLAFFLWESFCWVFFTHNLFTHNNFTQNLFAHNLIAESLFAERFFHSESFLSFWYQPTLKTTFHLILILLLLFLNVIKDVW